MRLPVLQRRAERIASSSEMTGCDDEQAAKAAAEDAAKAADEAEPKGDVVKQEKVKKTAQSHKNRTPLQSCCSQSVCVAYACAG